MKLRSVTPMKIAKYGYIAISAIFTLAGLAMIFYPTPSQSFIGIFFGIAILVFGIIKLVGYWSRDLFRLAFQYDLQFGVLLCVLGIITLIRHKDAVAFLCVAYGICIMADSLFKIRTALDAKAFGIRQWCWPGSRPSSVCSSLYVPWRPLGPLRCCWVSHSCLRGF